MPDFCARLYPFRYELVFNLLKYLSRKEKDLAPWNEAMIGLNRIGLLMKRTMARPALVALCRRLVRRQAARLGWQDEGNAEEKILRGLILSMACHGEHEPSLERVSERFEKFLLEDVTVPPNLRDVVYIYGMREVPRELMMLWLNEMEILYP